MCEFENGFLCEESCFPTYKPIPYIISEAGSIFNNTRIFYIKYNTNVNIVSKFDLKDITI